MRRVPATALGLRLGRQPKEVPDATADALDMPLFRTGVQLAGALPVCAQTEALGDKDFQRGLRKISAAQQKQEVVRPSPLQVPPSRGPYRQAPACLLVQNLGGALSPLQLVARGPDELACGHGSTPGFCPETWFSRL